MMGEVIIVNPTAFTSRDLSWNAMYARSTSEPKSIFLFRLSNIGPFPRLWLVGHALVDTLLL